MDGGESARRLDELDELGGVPDNPLFAMADLKVRGFPYLSRLRAGADRSMEAGKAKRGGRENPAGDRREGTPHPLILQRVGG